MTTKSAGVGFKDPPPPHPREAQYDWAKIARACRRKPGEYYLVFEQGRHSLATSIRSGGNTVFYPIVNRRQGQKWGFEVRTANTVQATEDHPRLCSMWLRYLPENGADSGTTDDQR